MNFVLKVEDPTLAYREREQCCTSQQKYPPMVRDGVELERPLYPEQVSFRRLRLLNPAFHVG
jgi:hypothetical protein